MERQTYTLGIDFDGTIVTHDYPDIGFPVPKALDTLRELVEKGHKLVLFTMRSGKQLEEAVEYLENNSVELYGINTNPTQHMWTESPKAYAEIYIDDAAMGTKLKTVDKIDRPFVDWSWVRTELSKLDIL